jgi:hypothetical protein
MPPALAERLPPIWQLPSAARLSGKSRSVLGCGLLNRRQHAARLGSQGVVDWIHRSHPVHPRQVDQNLVAAGARDLRTHQAGVSPLRHDAHLGLGAHPHHGRHLGGVRGLEQKRGLALVATAPLHQMRRQSIRIIAPAGRTGDLLQSFESGLVRGTGHGWCESEASTASRNA